MEPLDSTASRCASLSTIADICASGGRGHLAVHFVLHRRQLLLLGRLAVLALLPLAQVGLGLEFGCALAVPFGLRGALLPAPVHHPIADAADIVVVDGGGAGDAEKMPSDLALGVELDPHGFVRTVGERSEERRVGKECRSRWSPYH